MSLGNADVQQVPFFKYKDRAFLFQKREEKSWWSLLTTQTQRKKPTRRNEASYLDIEKSPKKNKVKPRRRGELRLQIPETELSGNTQTKVKFGRI